MQLQPKNNVVQVVPEHLSIALMDSLRQQFYPRMRQEGRDRKISDSHRKRIFLSHVWEWSITNDVITDQDFHQQCPLSRSNNRKDKTIDRKVRERMNISVGSAPGTFKRKRNHTGSLSYPLDLLYSSYDSAISANTLTLTAFCTD